MERQRVIADWNNFFLHGIDDRHEVPGSEIRQAVTHKEFRVDYWSVHYLIALFPFIFVEWPLMQVKRRMVWLFISFALHPTLVFVSVKYNEFWRFSPSVIRLFQSSHLFRKRLLFSHTNNGCEIKFLHCIIHHMICFPPPTFSSWLLFESHK